MKTQKKQPEWRRPVDAKSGKPYTEMTTDELREATREFDQPMFVERKSRAMTPAERAQYRRMLNGTAARRTAAPQARRRLCQATADEPIRSSRQGTRSRHRLGGVRGQIRSIVEVVLVGNDGRSPGPLLRLPSKQPPSNPSRTACSQWVLSRTLSDRPGIESPAPPNAARAGWPRWRCASDGSQQGSRAPRVFVG